ncbi:hypothetical protein [Methanolobus psychrotolerans]|uniref:hypothetical protein n=1 Tax=Methanolobus psychrotolerans TaxID=1874706 RepID=UPI000B918997|nr:hypothetical protein [Methanolobus psychrotolerans]
MSTANRFPGKDVFLMCGLFDSHKQCKYPHFWANACGLNFRFRLIEELNDIFIADMCKFFSGEFRSVYPFEDMFASCFSRKLFSVIKDQHEADSGLIVDILIEWKSVAMLIMSSKTSIPADLKVCINSKEYTILF